MCKRRKLELGIVRMIMTTTYEAKYLQVCPFAVVYSSACLSGRKCRLFLLESRAESEHSLMTGGGVTRTEPETVDLSLLLSLKTAEQHNQRLPIDVCQPLLKVVLVFL